MKHALIGLATFILVFAFIQFLGGAVGYKTVLDYGHANGEIIYLSACVTFFILFGILVLLNCAAQKISGRY